METRQPDNTHKRIYNRDRKRKFRKGENSDGGSGSISGGDDVKRNE